MKNLSFIDLPDDALSLILEHLVHPIPFYSLTWDERISNPDPWRLEQFRVSGPLSQTCRYLNNFIRHYVKTIVTIDIEPDCNNPLQSFRMRQNRAGKMPLKFALSLPSLNTLHLCGGSKLKELITKSKNLMCVHIHVKDLDLTLGVGDRFHELHLYGFATNQLAMCLSPTPTASFRNLHVLDISADLEGPGMLRDIALFCPNLLELSFGGFLVQPSDTDDETNPGDGEEESCKIQYAVEVISSELNLKILRIRKGYKRIAAVGEMELMEHMFYAMTGVKLCLDEFEYEAKVVTNTNVFTDDIKGLRSYLLSDCVSEMKLVVSRSFAYTVLNTLNPPGALCSLKELSLDNGRDSFPEMLVAIARNCPNLVKLSFEGWYWQEGARHKEMILKGVRSVATIRSLKILHIHQFVGIHSLNDIEGSIFDAMGDVRLVLDELKCKVATVQGLIALQMYVATGCVQNVDVTVEIDSFSKLNVDHLQRTLVSPAIRTVKTKARNALGLKLPGRTRLVLQ